MADAPTAQPGAQGDAKGPADAPPAEHSLKGDGAGAAVGPGRYLLPAPVSATTPLISPLPSPLARRAADSGDRCPHADRRRGGTTRGSPGHGRQ